MTEVCPESRMRTLVPPAAAAVLCLATLLRAAGPAAEEAVLPDGRHRVGALTFAQDRLTFQPAADQAALALAEIHAVRFAADPVPPLLAGRVHRVLLPDGQHLTGQLLGLDEQRLRVRTTWADDLAVPRAAVVAVTQLPGRDTFFADDFEPDLRGWKTSGSPGLGEQRSPAGQHCLLLDRPGQAASHLLDPATEAGVFAVDFQHVGAVSGASWVVEAEFQNEGGVRTARVTVGGDGDAYGAEVPGLKGTGYRLPRAPGWHRLAVEFTPASLAITVDDRALWEADGRGPGGRLRRVRLTCSGVGSTGGGAVAFADVSLSREVPEPRRPPGDPGQDEVWLQSGDQLFGRVPRADGRAVHVSGRFGERDLPWAEVRSIFLRRDRLAPAALDGERVRVWLQSGAGAERDELEGVVRGLDEHRLTLRSPLLGECRIERGRLRELRLRGR
jgi:hypothetical protein